MKNTREIAAEYRLTHWAEIMRERVESGLSITAYCEREGMHPNRYHYWQRRLRETAAKEILPAGVEKTPMPSGWMQVSTAEETEEAKNGGVTIEIGKCRIIAENNVNTELLRKVCKALVEIC